MLASPPLETGEVLGTFRCLKRKPCLGCWCHSFWFAQICHEPRCVCLGLSGPVYASKPLKYSLAGRPAQAGKLRFRWLFVCLQVILAAEGDTQLVVCAQLHHRAEAGLQACKGWSGADLFQLTPGLIWSQCWRSCCSAASSLSSGWCLRAWWALPTQAASIQRPSVATVRSRCAVGTSAHSGHASRADQGTPLTASNNCFHPSIAQIWIVSFLHELYQL